MQKDTKSSVRLSLEPHATRHSMFESLLESNYTQFFEENTTKDFMRSHQFVFTKPYHNSIESKVKRRKIKPSNRLGACYLRKVNDNGYDKLSYMYVDQ